jgi:hypothetical protein
MGAHRRRLSDPALRCTGRLVSGKVTSTSASDHANISRGGIRYAIGECTQRAGRMQLLLHDLRPLHPGRYTLEQTTRGHRTTVTTITLS